LNKVVVGQVCVPMDPEEVWDFNPEVVPTVHQLLREAKAVQKSKKGEAKTTGIASPLSCPSSSISIPFFTSAGYTASSFVLHCALQMGVGYGVIR